MALDFMKVSEGDAIRVAPDLLRAHVAGMFRACGVPDGHARLTAEILVTADLRGVDTHGVNGSIRYTEEIRIGRYTIPQELRVLSDSPATALLSNGNGLGYVGAHRAMEMAIEKARATGVGQVAVCDGHHIGMVAYYAMMALEHDMIGVAMTNSTRHARPAGGVEARVGTNPIAFAAPTWHERPFVLDMATSTVASGKVGLARRLGVSMPEGWVVDRHGEPVTTPPAPADHDWALNPLGGSLSLGGHKGYGLGVMVDVLTGVLSGGGYSGRLPAGDNHSWMMAIDIRQFRPVAEFKAMMDEMIAALHATPPEPGTDHVLVAGDPEAKTFEERSRAGIPLHRTLVEELRARARELGSAILI
ncbi:MAG: Ldh family oxidoreductase [Dehalococcoidia bacterium]|nr:MAG: Ldh family oxidoreductase [Dehalococcoidia bacterium]